MLVVFKSLETASLFATKKFELDYVTEKAKTDDNEVDTVSINNVAVFYGPLGSGKAVFEKVLSKYYKKISENEPVCDFRDLLLIENAKVENGF